MNIDRLVNINNATNANHISDQLDIEYQKNELSVDSIRSNLINPYRLAIRSLQTKLKNLSDDQLQTTVESALAISLDEPNNDTIKIEFLLAIPAIYVHYETREDNTGVVHVVCNIDNHYISLSESTNCFITHGTCNINASIAGKGIDYKFITTDKNFLKTLEENKKDLLRELSNYTYIGDDMTDGTDLYLAITQDDIDIIMDNLVDRLVDFGCKIVHTEHVDVEDDCEYEDYVDGHVCSYVFNIYIQNPTK